MKIYCEGSNCSRKHLCKLHMLEGDAVYQNIDWSEFGGGDSWTDEYGTHCNVVHSCGDNSDFSKFESICTQPVEILSNTEKSCVEYVLNPRPEDHVFLEYNNEKHNIQHIDWSKIDKITIYGNTFVRK